MVFLYYLPGLSRAHLAAGEKLSPALLRERGLAGVLADVTDVPRDATIADVQRGPDGESGVLLVPNLAAGDVPEVTIYQPMHQQWRAIGDGSRWIGYQLTAPPTPETLKRRECFDGYPVLDASGRRWIVPVARSPRPAEVTLPRTFRFDETTGAPISHVAAEYHALWQAACEISDWWGYTSYEHAVEAGELPKPRIMPERPPVADRDETWMIAQALAALAVNYRVGHAEINTLAEACGEVLTNRVVMQITLALIDRQIEREYWEKKTREAEAQADGSPSSEPGLPADCPATGPASAN